MARADRRPRRREDRTRPIQRVIVLTLVLWALWVPAAGAYIDPGSGSLIFQAVIAGVAAAGLMWKSVWRRLRALFGRSRSRSPLDDV